MSLLKYVERLKKMDDLIIKKSTGNAEEFAKKINVSSSQLFKELKEMKELGAPIQYSHQKRSYFYSRNCKMVLDFIEEQQSLVQEHKTFEILPALVALDGMQSKEMQVVV
jgi:predicted DNA-binding transcriptional regulator YafY